MYSKSLDRYYIGHTCDVLEERIRRHNSNHTGFTGKVNDWEVRYWESYSTKELAYAREREVKSWKSRRRLEILIYDF